MLSPSQNPCNSSPCAKNVTCRPSFLDDDSYTCFCPEGFTGAMCNEGKRCLMVNDAVMMHKCLKGLSPCYLSNKFSTRATIHDRQTRYRDSLNIPSSRINAGQRAFYYRGVKVWNNLSRDLKEIINAKVFKRRLINELIRNTVSYTHLTLPTKLEV